MLGAVLGIMVLGMLPEGVSFFGFIVELLYVRGFFWWDEAFVEGCQVCGKLGKSSGIR